jgi:ABC-type uncharacterized transport system permease subunit
MNERRFGYYVFGGLVLGAILGRLWSASSNPIVGMVIGAAIGMAIGWFAAAADIEKSNKDK